MYDDFDQALRKCLLEYTRALSQPQPTIQHPSDDRSPSKRRARRSIHIAGCWTARYAVHALPLTVICELPDVSGRSACLIGRGPTRQFHSPRRIAPSQRSPIAWSAPSTRITHLYRDCLAKQMAGARNCAVLFPYSIVRCMQARSVPNPILELRLSHKIFLTFNMSRLLSLPGCLRSLIQRRRAGNSIK